MDYALDYYHLLSAVYNGRVLITANWSKKYIQDYANSEKIAITFILPLFYYNPNDLIPKITFPVCKEI